MLIIKEEKQSSLIQKRRQTKAHTNVRQKYKMHVHVLYLFYLLRTPFFTHIAKK